MPTKPPFPAGYQLKLTAEQRAYAYCMDAGLGPTDVALAVFSALAHPYVSHEMSFGPFALKATDVICALHDFEHVGLRFCVVPACFISTIEPTAQFERRMIVEGDTWRVWRCGGGWLADISRYPHFTVTAASPIVTVYGTV